jgi:D-alanyl-lipoteichoic acid acyltransferase DltB (MBOAT superfamily)
MFAAAQGGYDPTLLEAWGGALAYTFQLYFDFSGYSDMAIGLGLMFNIRLPINFDSPYKAVNIVDFWRRWHITLSRFLRDYLYIPLGGSRRGPKRRYVNLMLTMLLGGLWHGAAWTYVLWGAYQGALLIVHRLLQPLLERLAPQGTWGARAWWLLRVLIMFQLTCLGWMIFRADSLTALGDMLGALGNLSVSGMVDDWLLPFSVLVLPLAAYQVVQAATSNLEVALRWPVPVRTAVYTALVFAIILLGEDFSVPFIYFQF